MKYRKFNCAKCGHSWLGYAKKPKCRKCGSKMVNIAPAIIDEDYIKDLQKKAGEKEIINKFQKKKSVKIEAPKEKEGLTIEPKITNEKMVEENKEEFNESLFYGGSAVETPQDEPKEPEEVTYKCACGGDIQRGQLFCHKCGSALDIDWNIV